MNQPPNNLNSITYSYTRPWTTWVITRRIENHQILERGLEELNLLNKIKGLEIQGQKNCNVE